MATPVALPPHRDPTISGVRARPVAVSFIASFLLAAAVIAAVVGTSLLWPGTLLDRMWELNQPAHAAFQPLGRVSGLALWLLGILTAVAGFGLLRGQNWAWRIAIAVFVANGLGDVVNLLWTADWLRSGTGVLIIATFLFLLLRPSVTAFFGHRITR